jgi:hypothetical protein
MDRSDSQRLQNDLETLRTVLGTELPFQRVDVRGYLAVGICALLPGLACLAGGRSGWLLLGSSVPFLAALALLLVRNFRATDPSQPCPAAKRREYRLGLPLVILSIPLIFGFHWWASAAGSPAGVRNGCVMLFFGLMLLYQGLYEAGRRAALFVALPAIAAGLLWPFVTYFELWTTMWLATGLGMIAAAMFMRWQLSSYEACATPPDARRNG